MSGGVMKRFFLAVLLVALSLALAQAPARAPSQGAAPTPTQAVNPAEWTLAGTGRTCYTMDTSGHATDAEGATVTLRSVQPVPAKQFGTITARIPADPMKGRRVKISGELRTQGAVEGASLWVRIDRDASTLMLDNGMDRLVRGDAEWTRRSVSLPVSADATTVLFGVILQGNGSVAVRGLRLESLSADGPIAPEAGKVLDAAITIVKTNALRSSTVDWAAVEPEVRTLAAGAEQSSDVYPAIQFMLSKLGDRHSFLMPPAQTSAFKTGGAENPPADVRALPERVGYIGVPAYGGADAAAAKAYATRVHQGIATTMAAAACGWVVDLRANGGGNMWPMLAGLKPLLGNEPLGTFDGPKGKGAPWRAGAGVEAKPPATLAALESAWVAVLTGPRTASSGEAVVIAFRGRPHTRSFGLPTAGLSTANRTFGLPDGSMILLTTAVDADRTGRRYGDKVEPDETVAANPPSGVGDEPTIAAAIRWLTQASGCAKVPQ
jgi:C-terminal processing protease CtpA/Prc